MKNNTYLLTSKIELIEKTDNLIKKMIGLPDEDDGTIKRMSVKSMERKKQHLIEELLEEMIDARLSFIQFKDLYEKIFYYLEKRKRTNVVTKDWQKKINNAKQFLQVSTY